MYKILLKAFSLHTDTAGTKGTTLKSKGVHSYLAILYWLCKIFIVAKSTSGRHLRTCKNETIIL